MTRLDTYFKVQRPYLPIAPECEEEEDEGPYVTFKFEFTTNAWSPYSGFSQEISYASGETIIPVIVEENDPGTAAMEAVDGQTISDYATSPSYITFQDSEGNICIHETVIFDPENRRYKWWVNVENTQFKNDGILYLLIKYTLPAPKKYVWASRLYKDEDLIPIHLDGLTDYVDIQRLPSPAHGSAEDLYKGIHTLMFAVVHNPFFNWAAEEQAQQDGLTRAFPLLKIGPIIVYVRVYANGYRSMSFHINVLNGRTGIYNSSNPNLILGIPVSPASTPQYKSVYACNEYAVEFLCLLKWGSGGSEEIPGFKRIPKNDGSDSDNQAHGSANAVAYVSRWPSRSVEVGALACFTKSTPEELEAMKLELYPEVDLSRDEIDTVVLTPGPLRIAEIRFNADLDLAGFYEPSYEVAYVDYDNDSYGYNVTDTSNEFVKYKTRLHTLHTLLNQKSVPQYIDQNEVTEPNTPIIPCLPCPNTISITYQGLSGEQY